MHDSLGCVDLWRDLPSQLCSALSRPIIAYDRLGFGRSDARADRPSLAFIAEEAPQYFSVIHEQLALDSVVIMGHSVGGGMGVYAAAQLGERCEALVTLAAQVFAEERTLEGIRAARESFRDPAQRERLARYHGAKAPWVIEAWTENWLAPGFASWSALDTLPKVHSPILAIHGEDDEYGTTRHAKLISERCGGRSQLELMAKTGHLPHREQPARVIELMSAFLRSATSPLLAS